MRYKIIFSCILLIAIVSRFYKLGSLPNGLTWDEAAIGYNAYGILTNHRDEWLHRMPVVFQSFGDFKSPLLVYVTAISVALFHLTPFAIRLPIALAGVGTVVVSYFLALEIFHQQKKIALFVMLFLALSPWAILYSRVGFEATLANFLITLGVYCILRWAREPKFWILAIGVMNLVLSLYAYHSPKVVIPLIGVVLATVLRKQWKTQRGSLLIASVLALILLIPLGYASVFGKANSRALDTTILHQANAIPTFFSHLLTQLSPAFLLSGKDLNFRQSTKEMGVSTPVELLCAVIGLIAIIKSPSMRKYWWIPTLVLIGCVPAALGIDVPHSIRALNVLPWVQLLAGVGVLVIFNTKKSRILTVVVVVLALFSFGQFVRTYERVYTNSRALSDFGCGYQEAIAYARSQESQVDKVYITNHFGQAYIYLLFFKGLTPIEYQGGGLANYVISDRPFADAQGHTPALIIGTPEEVPATQNVVKEIKYPDGKVVFRIVRQ